MKVFFHSLFFCILLLCAGLLYAVELVIGEERVPPGIVFVFEGAVKDEILPAVLHLDASHTDVHIEARVNWDSKDIPVGTPGGGFIPALKVVAEVENQTTGAQTKADLLMHLNLIDNFHYARNISLPGKRSDLYTVTFSISPPGLGELSFHKDWVSKYQDRLIEELLFTFRDVDFEEIANSVR